MNRTTAACGCTVIAVGQAGSQERLAVEGDLCPICKSLPAGEWLEPYESLARQYGSPNCWTGTSGTLAAALLRLIRRVRLLEENTK